MNRNFIKRPQKFWNRWSLCLKEHPEFIEANLLERFIEPERQVMFRVPWFDDKGNVQINRGFRIQFNSAIRAL